MCRFYWKLTLIIKLCCCPEALKVAVPTSLMEIKSPAEKLVEDDEVCTVVVLTVHEAAVSEPFLRTVSV